MSENAIDGRTQRATETREKIIAACRGLMAGGDFRPSGKDIVSLAGVSIRTCFAHFGEVGTLYQAALATTDFRQTVAALIIPGSKPEAIFPSVRDAILHAAVFGKVGTLPPPIDKPAVSEAA